MAEENLSELGEVVQLPQLSHLHQSGIYFLWHEGAVVYVGKGKDMRSRIADHLADPLKTFDAASGLPFPERDLNRAERYFIEKLVPKYNQCNVAKALKERGSPDLDIALPAFMETKLAAGKAAEYLGITVDELVKLKDKGLRAHRKPRSPSRYYFLSEVMAFKESPGQTVRVQ